jgi:hypothetical protein
VCQHPEKCATPLSPLRKAECHFLVERYIRYILPYIQYIIPLIKMPIDCLNKNIPVYDPTPSGCYDWMSIRAGGESKFCGKTTFEGETQFDGDAVFNGQLAVVELGPVVQAEIYELTSNNITVNEELSVTGGITAGGCVEAPCAKLGPAPLLGDPALEVTGDATVANLEATGDVTVGNDITVSGCINHSGCFVPPLPGGAPDLKTPFGMVHPLSLEISNPWSLPPTGVVFPPVLFDAFDTQVGLPLPKDFTPLALPYAIFDKATATITIQKIGQYKLDYSMSVVIENESALPSTKFSVYVAHPSLAAPSEVITKCTALVSGQDVDTTWNAHRVFSVFSVPYTLQIGYTVVDPPPTEGIFIDGNDILTAGKNSLTLTCLYDQEPQTKIPL